MMHDPDQNVWEYLDGKDGPSGRLYPWYQWVPLWIWGWITYWPWQVREMKQAGMIRTGWMEWSFPDGDR